MRHDFLKKFNAWRAVIFSVKSGKMCSEWWANEEIQGRQRWGEGRKDAHRLSSPHLLLLLLSQREQISEEDAALHPRSAQEKYMRGDRSRIWPDREEYLVVYSAKQGDAKADRKPWRPPRLLHRQLRAWVRRRKESWPSGTKPSCISRGA